MDTPENEKKFQTYIVFGEQVTSESIPVHYAFYTQRELDAFLDGLDAAIGWFDYEIWDEEDVRRFYATDFDESELEAEGENDAE